LSGRIGEGNVKVFGRKGDLGYTQKSRDVFMDCRWNVKKKELELIQIKGCARGFTEVNEDSFEFNDFLSSESVH
jgi:hypothetical protein